jgi:exopolysaccharide biosynthesis polyprenyl glycosylphosphotransferase
LSEMRQHRTSDRPRLQPIGLKYYSPAALHRSKTTTNPHWANPHLHLLETFQPQNEITRQPERQTNGSIPSPNPRQEATLRNQRLNLALRLIIDLLLINATFIVAYLIRYNLQWGAEVSEENHVPLSAYIGGQIAYVGIFFVVLQFKGFYRLSRTVTLIDEVGMIASAAAYSILTMLALIFLTRPLEVSRLMFFYLFPISLILLGTERWVSRRIQSRQVLKGIGIRKVLVVGATDPATRIMQAIVETPALGLQLVGYVDDQLRFSEWTLPLRYHNNEPVPHLGELEHLSELVEKYQVDELIVALPATMHENINEVINLCYELNIEFALVPDVFELQVNILDFQELNGVPLIGIKDNRLTGWNYLVKRAVDIALALLVLLFMSIPMLLTAIAVKLDSPGPIILRQTRIGKHGRPFPFYKFRSMYIDADERFEELKKFNQTGGATFKMVNDPRRTRVGRFIRRTSIDELPQLFDILLGHMSFIGPRPGLEREIKQYQEWHFRRLEVTPGLTGLAQVSGRSNLKFDEMVRLDIHYAENWSLWLDFKILLRTVPTVLRRDGAY